MSYSRSVRTHKQILLVDDSPAQAELLAHALTQQESAATMHVETSADAAMRFLERHPASFDAIFPALVLIDLKLGGATGLDLLRRLRADRRFSCLPAVVFTTSDNPDDIRASYVCGANGYVVKPAQFTDLVRLIDDVCRYWLSWNKVSEGC